MATRAVAFHDEVKRKRGHVHRLLLPDREPTWRGRQQRYKVPSSISKLYPDNAGLAAALGFGTAKSPRRHRSVSRSSFMGEARRWRAGKRDPQRSTKWAKPLASVGREAQRKLATPNTEGDVLALMLEYGATVNRVAAHFVYDDDDRDIRRAVFVSPEVLGQSFDGMPSFADLAAGSRHTWGAMAEAFLTAWSFAYSGNENLFGNDALDKVTALSFQLGRPVHVDYEHGIGRAA